MTGKCEVVIHGDIPFASGSVYKETVVDVKNEENYLVLVFENSRRSINHDKIEGYDERPA